MTATQVLDVNEEDLPEAGKRTVFRISKRFQLTLPHQRESLPNQSVSP